MMFIDQDEVNPLKALHIFRSGRLVNTVKLRPNFSGEQMKFGIGTVLFLIFLVLKLTGVIVWSWWFVTMPLWGITALVLALYLSTFTIGFFIGAVKGLASRFQ